MLLLKNKSAPQLSQKPASKHPTINQRTILVRSTYQKLAFPTKPAQKTRTQCGEKKMTAAIFNHACAKVAGMEWTKKLFHYNCSEKKKKKTISLLRAIISTNFIEVDSMSYQYVHKILNGLTLITHSKIKF